MDRCSPVSAASETSSEAPCCLRPRIRPGTCSCAVAAPQYQARADIIEVLDEDLGPIKMTNAFPFMSETPAEIRHAGPRKGQHNHDILVGELGLSEHELVELEKDNVI